MLFFYTTPIITAVRISRIRIIRSLIVFCAWYCCSATALANVIEGTVYEDRGGAPLLSALVRVSGADGVVLKEIESGGDGRFLIEGLGAWEYRLAITKASFMPLEARVSARHSGPTEIPAMGNPREPEPA